MARREPIIAGVRSGAFAVGPCAAVAVVGVVDAEGWPAGGADEGPGAGVVKLNAEEAGALGLAACARLGEERLSIGLHGERFERAFGGGCRGHGAKAPGRNPWAGGGGWVEAGVAEGAGGGVRGVGSWCGERCGLRSGWVGGAWCGRFG